MSSAQTRRSCRPSGTSRATIRCASPSAIAVFPTPGSPIRTGLFFVRRERIWITRRISSSRPITGSSLPGLRGLGQVAPELRERLIAALRILRGHALASPDLLDPGEDLLARHRLERQEQVLGRDVVVLELRALCDRPRREPARASSRSAAGCSRRRLPTGREASFCLGLRAQALPVGEEVLVEQREQQVLGVDLRVAAAARELLRRGDRLLPLDRQPWKSTCRSPLVVPCRCTRPRPTLPSSRLAGGCGGR